jgi:hypothetical protein
MSITRKTSGSAKMAIDPWEEIHAGRADQAGANYFWLYSAVKTNDLKLLAITLKAIIRREEWRHWRWIGQDFECKSLRELRKPPNGVGTDLKILRRLIADDNEALDKLDEALRNPVGTNQYPDQTSLNFDEGRNNVMTHYPPGNSIENALRRLRSDERPIAKELHAKVMAGELSAHRAAVLAGYRRVPTPFEIVQRNWPKLTPEQREKIIAMEFQP